MKTENETVYSFPKNPLEEVRAGVTVFRGKQYVDLRIYYKGDDGEFHPSKKGLTLSIELFPELEEAVKKLREVVAE
ncbi:MAG: transcriptional coactivator p15/PC4 family protein [Syntrophobacteraceae bacterium]|nr:transcriptional coactivator p15/PC4 family protein [Syntrophobacteraceae bacterium]